MQRFHIHQKRGAQCASPQLNSDRLQAGSLGHVAVVAVEYGANARLLERGLLRHRLDRGGGARVADLVEVEYQIVE